MSRHTSTGPRELAGSQSHGSILVNLEPNGALAVKSGSRLALGDLGHVKVQGTGMADVVADDKRVVGSGRDGQSLGGALAGVELVAGHGFRGDVGNGAAVVVVLGHADVFIFSGDGASGVALGESVWQEVLVKKRLTTWIPSSSW